MAKKQRARTGMAGARAAFWVAFGLFAAGVALYAPTAGFDPIGLDDDSHVFENPIVRGGLTWPGVVAAFGAHHAALWMPFAWISHMLDVSLFGLDPGAMHLVNALWHGANSGLLAIALWRLTGSLGRSAAVAALFAVHPVNVESVAWIAERKNLLCAFFWIAAMGFYAEYAARGRRWGWWGSLAAFAAALLSKPMAVTFPCALLLLDAWPLDRWKRVGWRRLFAEKLPFFALTAAACAVTLAGPKGHGFEVSAEELPLVVRATNALVSYAVYLGDLAWPTELCGFYLHPRVVQGELAAVSAVLLAGVSAVLWAWRKAQPAAWIGWLWYLGILVPVIGWVQVGEQARADRFLYLPQIMLFAGCVWAGAGLVQGATARRWAWGGLAALLVALGTVTARQVAYWKDSVVFFRRATEVTRGNARAYVGLGGALASRGEHAAAIPAYREALRWRPFDADTWNNLGAALLRVGDGEKAIDCFVRALVVDPKFSTARYNLGREWAKRGDRRRALAAFRTVVEQVPGFARGRFRLAEELAAAGDRAGALEQLREAARLAPGDAEIAAALREAEAGR